LEFSSVDFFIPDPLTQGIGMLFPTRETMSSSEVKGRQEFKAKNLQIIH
jgi:hypothetical protein